MMMSFLINKTLLWKQKCTRPQCFRPKCGKRFKRESELNAHLIAHNKKVYKCEECAYSNTDPRNLRAHQRRHSDKKPFLCPKCGKGFKWVQQRKRHLEGKNC